MSSPASSAPPPSVGRAVAASLEAAQRLLLGPGWRARWKALVVLAAMAGLVGAGTAPPPLGLLQPVWADPALHRSVFGHRGVVASLIFLALFLIFMGGFGRSFTLGFFEGLRTGAPERRSYRRHLQEGVAHFLWSSALSLPLYALLFAGEAVVAHDALAQLTAQLGAATSTDTELMTLVLQAIGKFLLVLVPWALITLPAMVTIYELTPATMVSTGLGPAAAFRRVWAFAGRWPKAFSAYVGVRYLLQILGNLVALLALLPSLLISSPLIGPLLGVGWQVGYALGGPRVAGGAAVLTTGTLFAAVVLYCALCTVLLPVSVFLNSVAVQLITQCEQLARDTPVGS